MARNIVTVKQNQPQQIELLRAIRYTYSSAKLILGVQFFLLVMIPCLGSIIVLGCPSIKGLVAAISIVSLMADVAFLDAEYKKLQKRGAVLQEQFDTEVLQLEWNAFLAGKKSSHEAVYGAGRRYLRGAEDRKLENWYPVSVSELPLHVARLICQRTNLWVCIRRRPPCVRDGDSADWLRLITAGAETALCLEI